MKILSSPSNLYNLNQPTRVKNAKQNISSISFMAAPNTQVVTKTIYQKVMGPVEEKIAKGCVKFLETNTMEKLVKKTNGITPKIDSKTGKTKKFTDGLTSHLIVLGSTILSGFYVLKTLQNKNMDEDKRKTLAINQGLVYVASTIMAYTFDGWARKKTDVYIKAFEQVHKDMDAKKLKGMVTGMKNARSIITIDTVYRFLAPVAVTPLANWIGNKLAENRAAKNQLAKENISKVA